MREERAGRPFVPRAGSLLRGIAALAANLEVELAGIVGRYPVTVVGHRNLVALVHGLPCVAALRSKPSLQGELDDHSVASASQSVRY
jgi:hypothetical protein